MGFQTVNYSKQPEVSPDSHSTSDGALAVTSPQGATPSSSHPDHSAAYSNYDNNLSYRPLLSALINSPEYQRVAAEHAQTVLVPVTRESRQQEVQNKQSHTPFPGEDQGPPVLISRDQQFTLVGSTANPQRSQPQQTKESSLPSFYVPIIPNSSQNTLTKAELKQLQADKKAKAAEKKNEKKGKPIDIPFYKPIIAPSKLKAKDEPQSALSPTMPVSQQPVPPSESFVFPGQTNGATNAPKPPPLMIPVTQSIPQLQTPGLNTTTQSRLDALLESPGQLPALPSLTSPLYPVRLQPTSSSSEEVTHHFSNPSNSGEANDAHLTTALDGGKLESELLKLHTQQNSQQTSRAHTPRSTRVSPTQHAQSPSIAAPDVLDQPAFEPTTGSVPQIISPVEDVQNKSRVRARTPSAVTSLILDRINASPPERSRSVTHNTKKQQSLDVPFYQPIIPNRRQQSAPMESTQPPVSPLVASLERMASISSPGISRSSLGTFGTTETSEAPKPVDMPFYAPILPKSRMGSSAASISTNNSNSGSSEKNKKEKKDKSTKSKQPTMDVPFYRPILPKNRNGAAVGAVPSSNTNADESVSKSPKKTKSSGDLFGRSRSSENFYVPIITKSRQDTPSSPTVSRHSKEDTVHSLPAFSPEIRARAAVLSLSPGDVDEEGLAQILAQTETRNGYSQLRGTQSTDPRLLPFHVPIVAKKSSQPERTSHETQSRTLDVEFHTPILPPGRRALASESRVQLLGSRTSLHDNTPMSSTISLPYSINSDSQSFDRQPDTQRSYQEYSQQQPHPQQPQNFQQHVYSDQKHHNAFIERGSDSEPIYQVDEVTLGERRQFITREIEFIRLGLQRETEMGFWSGQQEFAEFQRRVEEKTKEYKSRWDAMDREKREEMKRVKQEQQQGISRKQSVGQVYPMAQGQIQGVDDVRESPESLNEQEPEQHESSPVNEQLSPRAIALDSGESGPELGVEESEERDQQTPEVLAHSLPFEIPSVTSITKAGPKLDIPNFHSETAPNNSTAHDGAAEYYHRGIEDDKSFCVDTPVVRSGTQNSYMSEYSNSPNTPENDLVGPIEPDFYPQTPVDTTNMELSDFFLVKNDKGHYQDLSKLPEGPSPFENSQGYQDINIASVSPRSHSPITHHAKSVESFRDIAETTPEVEQTSPQRRPLRFVEEAAKRSSAYTEHSRKSPEHNAPNARTPIERKHPHISPTTGSLGSRSSITWDSQHLVHEVSESECSQKNLESSGAMPRMSLELDEAVSRPLPTSHVSRPNSFVEPNHLTINSQGTVLSATEALKTSVTLPNNHSRQEFHVNHPVFDSYTLRPLPVPSPIDSKVSSEETSPVEYLRHASLTRQDSAVSDYSMYTQSLDSSEFSVPRSVSPSLVATDDYVIVSARAVVIENKPSPEESASTGLSNLPSPGKPIRKIAHVPNSNMVLPSTSYPLPAPTLYDPQPPNPLQNYQERRTQETPITYMNSRGQSPVHQVQHIHTGRNSPVQPQNYYRSDVSPPRAYHSTEQYTQNLKSHSSSSIDATRAPPRQSFESDPRHQSVRPTLHNKSTSSSQGRQSADDIRARSALDMNSRPSPSLYHEYNSLQKQNYQPTLPQSQNFAVTGGLMSAEALGMLNSNTPYQPVNLTSPHSVSGFPYAEKPRMSAAFQDKKYSSSDLGYQPQRQRHPSNVYPEAVRQAQPPGGYGSYNARVEYNRSASVLGHSQLRRTSNSSSSMLSTGSRPMSNPMAISATNIPADSYQQQLQAMQQHNMSSNNVAYPSPSAAGPTISSGKKKFWQRWRKENKSRSTEVNQDSFDDGWVEQEWDGRRP